jgi:signal transduction histidine kinase
MARSIRQQLFAALAGFTVLICVCYTGLAVVISYVTEDMMVERMLEREAGAIVRHVARHGSIPAPRNDLVAVYRSYGELPALVRQGASAASGRAEVFTDSGQHYHLMALDLGTRRIWLLADVGSMLVVSKIVQDVGGVLIFVALALLALALLLAWLLARRLVAPLQVLATEARALKPGEPIAFSARGRQDEIGFLAERLETSFSELQTALLREHDFTRDVGHELRTPLTVMNNTLALAAARPLGAADIAQLRGGLDEVRNTIDVLFALARAGHVRSERFDLRATIEQCLLRLVDEGHCEAERLVFELPERMEVSGNPHLAALLLNNCLGNALFHGGPQTRLSLLATGGRLCIGNTIDTGMPGRVQGFSHGQNLLQRIARAMDWELRFHPGEAEYWVDIVPRP